MNKHHRIYALLSFAALLAVACGSARYVSADPDLESIYVGKSYYDIVNEFGRPASTSFDDRNGTLAVYGTVPLNGTRAERLVRQYTLRNRATKEETTEGRITFSFDDRMRCYAVESDLLREKSRGSEASQTVHLGTNPNLSTKAKPQVPRTIDLPSVKGRSPFAQVVSVERVEVLEDQTKITFSYCDRTPKHRPLHDKGLTIHKDVFIRDCATNQHIKLIKPEGITLYPDYTPFAHYRGGYDMLVYTLVFEAIPPEAEFIDVVEPGAEGFNFYTIDVRTPLTFRQSLQQNPLK